MTACRELHIVCTGHNKWIAKQVIGVHGCVYLAYGNMVREWFWSTTDKHCHTFESRKEAIVVSLAHIYEEITIRVWPADV